MYLQCFCDCCSVNKTKELPGLGNACGLPAPEKRKKCGMQSKMSTVKKFDSGQQNKAKCCLSLTYSDTGVLLKVTDFDFEGSYVIECRQRTVSISRILRILQRTESVAQRMFKYAACVSSACLKYTQSYAHNA